MENGERHNSNERKGCWDEAAKGIGGALRQAADRFEVPDVKQRLLRDAEAYELVMPIAGREIEELASHDFKVLCSFCGRNSRHMFGDSPSLADPTVWICDRCLDSWQERLCEQREADASGE